MEETLAARLRSIMERSGLHQAELARRAAVDQATVSRWLSGQSEPNVAQLRRLLAALSISAGELLGETSRGRSSVRAVEVKRQDGVGTWLVFRDDEFVGEWVGRTIEALGPVEVVTGVEAERLARTTPRRGSPS